MNDPLVELKYNGCSALELIQSGQLHCQVLGPGRYLFKLVAGDVLEFGHERYTFRISGMWEVKLPNLEVKHLGYRETATTEKEDLVNHPKHYTNHPSGIECIQITRHMNFNLGNVLKYIWRTDHKNGLEDLKKARWYLDDEIKRREKNG